MTGLDAMKQYPQWITYILRAKPNGKTDKLPVSPHTGQVCNAHDPAAWAAYDMVKAAGLPLAFVFTAADPFWALDLDDCLQSDGQWSPEAVSICTTLAGATFEVSPSGRGLHGYGTKPADIPHGSRGPGMEFYTSGRFMTITEYGVTGSADFIPDQATYAQFLAQYFPPGAATVSPDAEWTTGPIAEWLGPDDDQELIARMLRSRSAKSIVGVGVTVKHLWNADEDALSKAYPDSLGPQGRAFDWSQADAALCSHLAFWTGKDCARIDRLWGMSALGQRDKYHDRPDYRQRSVLQAASICKKVYRDRKMVAPAGPSVGPGGDGLRIGYQFLAPQDQQSLFTGCAYVRDVHRVYVPDGGLLKPDQFKAVYGGHVFALDNINDKTTRNAWEAFTESQALETERVHSTCFRPEHKSGEIIANEGQRLLNTYVPIDTDRAAGDPALFLDLMARLLPEQGDRDILLAYMAACVQYPGVKFQWAPVIQGTFGNGKSLLSGVLSFCIGHRYTNKVNAQDIGNVFNAWILNKLLIIIDEIKIQGASNAVETLKWLITDDRVPIQLKGFDQMTGDNRANFMLCTNHEDGVIKTRNDRRFSVFFTAQQNKEDIISSGMGGVYFPRLVAWLKGGGYAIVNNYLRRYQIPDALNPATLCVWAPETTSNEQAVIESAGGVGQEIAEAIGEGQLGFKDGWISSMAVSRILGNKLPHTRRLAEILDALGYVRHPALYRGRSSRHIMQEGGKPRLYVKRGHISCNIESASTILNMYCDAQGYPPGMAGATAVGATTL